MLPTVASFLRNSLGLEQPADDPLMPGAVPPAPYSPYDDGYASSAPIPPTAAPAPAAPPFPQPAPVAAPTLTYNDPTAPELYNGGGVMPSGGGVMPSGGGTPDATNASPSSVAQPAPSPPVQNALNLLSDPGNTGTVHGPAYAPPTQAEAEEDARRALDASPQIRPPLTNPVYAARDAAVETARQVVTPPESVEDAADRFIKSIFSLGLGAGPPAMIVQAAQQAGGDALGRAVARLLGLGNREVARLFGDSVTEEDVAGFAGSVVTDPTVYVGGGGAIRSGARGLRGALERGTEAATNLVGRTLVGGLGGAGVGLATGQDTETTGQMAAGGALAGAGAPLVRPVARVAGRALEPLGRELGEQMLARAPRMMQETGGSQGGRPIQMTVEVLRERMDMLRDLRERARAVGDAETEQDAVALLRQYEDELIDAMNARLDLEPALESDVGRRIETLPRDARALDPRAPERIPNAEIPRTVDDAPRGGSISLNAGLGGVPDDTSRALAQRTAPRAGQVDDILPDYDNPAVALADDIKWHRQHIEDFRKTLQDPTARPGAVEYARQWLPAYERELADMERRYAAMLPGAEDIPVQPIPSRPAGSAAAPSAPGRDILATATRAVSEPLVGGFGGAVINQGMNPDDPDAARTGFLTGMVGFPLATRGARTLARRAGAQGADDAGGALASLGGLPGMGPVGRRWQQAQARAAAQAAAARAAGKAPPATAGDWLRTIGYSGMIGPGTGIVNALGNGLELVYHLPKDLVRSIARGNVREAGAEMQGLLTGFMRSGGEILDALAGAHPGGGVETARLSQRVQNPLGQFAAQLIESPMRVFSEVPDAFYRSVATSMGEARQAAQIATTEGLSGAAWSQRVQQLLSDVSAHRAGGPASSEVVQIIKDGHDLAERLTLRGEIGPRGKAFKAGIDALPFGLGNLVMPFFNTPYHMLQRQLERSPVGLRMGTQPSRFDKHYDAIVGTGIAAGVAGLGLSGAITGSGPDDAEKRRQLQSQGWQSNSTLVAGRWIPNNTFGVFGPMLDLAGELGDAARYQKKDATARDFGGQLVKRASAVVSNQVYLRGISDLLKAMDDPAAFAESYAAQTASRFIPLGASARLAGTMADPNERQVERGADVGSAEAIRQRVARGLPGQGIPPIGGREGLPVAQDVLGRPVENERQGLAALGPRMRTPRPDAVIQAYTDAGIDIGNPPSSFTQDGVKIEMTPEQQRDYQRYMGEHIIRGFDRANGASDRRRAGQLQALYDEAREKAQARVRADIGRSEIRTRVRAGSGR